MYLVVPRARARRQAFLCRKKETTHMRGVWLITWWVGSLSRTPLEYGTTNARV